MRVVFPTPASLVPYLTISAVVNCSPKPRASFFIRNYGGQAAAIWFPVRGWGMPLLTRKKRDLGEESRHESRRQVENVVCFGVAGARIGRAGICSYQWSRAHAADGLE